MSTLTRTQLARLKHHASTLAADIKSGVLMPGRGDCAVDGPGDTLAPCCTIGHFYHRMGMLDSNCSYTPMEKLLGTVAVEVEDAIGDVTTRNDDGDFDAAADALLEMAKAVENTVTIVED